LWHKFMKGDALILPLGTFHFAESASVISVDLDVMAERRQREILDVVEGLERFEPTAVALERPPESQKALNRAYRAFRSGERGLGRSETEQIGFRLAARLGHESVHAVDHLSDIGIQRVLEYAGRHGPSFVEAFWSEIRTRKQEDQERTERSSIREELIHLNSPEQRTRDHTLYVTCARVGAGHGNAGADLLSAWYGRNIQILANLFPLLQPGERVLLIIGAGHVHILRQLLEYVPRVGIVEPSRYLTGIESQTT
jgi:hypothetical protein